MPFFLFSVTLVIISIISCIATSMMPVTRTMVVVVTKDMSSHYYH